MTKPANTSDQLLASAVAAHQSGRRAEAEKFYTQAIALRPKDAQALYLLGGLYYEMKHYDAAQEKLVASLDLRPDYLPAQSVLGATYAALGKPDQALAFLENVVKANPQSASAHYNLGRALFDLQRHAESAALMRQAVQIQPAHDAALMALGLSLKEQGLFAESAQALRDCIAKAPQKQEAYIALAEALMAKGDDDAAEQVLRTALRQFNNPPQALQQLGNLKFRQLQFAQAEVLFRGLVAQTPQDAMALCALGTCLLNQGRLAEAEEVVRSALVIDPAQPQALMNLGLVLSEKGDAVSGEKLQRQAIALKPDFAEAWNNLGFALQLQGKLEDAIAAFDRAIAIYPQFHGAKTNKAVVLLTLGRLSDAWPIYGNRFEQKLWASKKRTFPYPLWDGAPNPKTKLLLWTDQGLGDEVLYASMIGDVSARVETCILECAGRMVGLFQRSFPHLKVIARQTTPDPAIAAFAPDYQLPLVDLGSLVRPDVASIPKHNGYLTPDPVLKAKLRAKYEAIAAGRRIVGLSWKSQNTKMGSFKSTSLASWAPILATPDVLFVSLQYGDVSADIADAKQHTKISVHEDPDVDALHDLDASAAQIAAMDLVVTTSNSTAHFAGGLAVPVWTLVPTGPGALWYWFLEHADSPWYPTMRLFRQPVPGDWASVIRDVAAALGASGQQNQPGGNESRE